MPTEKQCVYPGVTKPLFEPNRKRKHINQNDSNHDREIVCLQGKRLDANEISEYCKRTGGMATLYGCIKKTQPKYNKTIPVTTVHTMPMTLFPSTIPRDVIEEGKLLQRPFNSLLHRVAHDHEFLHYCLKDVIKADEFLEKMWHICEKSRRNNSRSKLGLGIFRNDFMLVPSNDVTNRVSDETVDSSKVSKMFQHGDMLQLKQVEFNGMAVGTAGMLTNTRECHRYALSLAGVSFQEKQLPVNEPINGIADGLIKAWNLYDNTSAVILFVVQDEPLYLNPDQRWVERRIFEKNSSIRVVYRSFNLLKNDHEIKDGNLYVSGQEVAVVYYRMGYEASHYSDEQEYDVRLKMELSNAIMCPPIQYFLAQTKKVQQVLSEEGCLEKFVEDPDVADRIRQTFVQQYAFEQGNAGDRIAKMAMKTPEKFVLKSQHEGGGTCCFSKDDIQCRLEEITDSKERCSYVLMERILPVYQYNVFITPGQDTKIQPVTNELGVYGMLLGTSETEIENSVAGISIKTKHANDDEGGLSGSGYVDSPFLLDW